MMHRRRDWSVLFVALVCMACGNNAEVPPSASQDTGEVETSLSDADARAIGGNDAEDTEALTRGGDAEERAASELTRTLCGQTPYTWLSTETMGDIIAQEPKPLYSLPIDVVTALLADSGFIDVLDLRYDVEVLVLRHRTQDRGLSVETTALIGLPVLPDEEALSASTVAFLAGTSGFSEACAGSQSEGNALAAILYAAQGYITVLPDYLGKAGFGGDDGLAHPYLVSEAAAIATLDGIRAATQLVAERGGALSHNAQVFVWGGSQGGHAAYATERYAPYYAPEFEIVGGIATVAPSDLVGQTERALTELGPAAVGVLASCITLAEWHGMWDRIGEIVMNEGAMPLASSLRDQMQNICYPDLTALGVDTIEDAFTPAFLDAVQAGTWEGFEDWRCLFRENSTRHQSLERVSDVPFLSVLATNDELVNLEVERASHAVLCEQGYDLKTLVCDQASHTDGTTWSVREQFAWFHARMAGQPLEGACLLSSPRCCEESPEEICDPTR